MQKNSSIDDDLERRLQNWARWTADAGPYSTARISIVYSGGARGRRAEPSMPLISGEAVELDMLIGRLSTSHRDALRAHYARRGPAGQWLGTLSEMAVAQALGCARSTLHERLASARKRLVVELADRRRTMAQARQQFEAAQRHQLRP